MKVYDTGNKKKRFYFILEKQNLLPLILFKILFYRFKIAIKFDCFFFL